MSLESNWLANDLREKQHHMNIPMPCTTFFLLKSPSNFISLLKPTLSHNLSNSICSLPSLSLRFPLSFEPSFSLSLCNHSSAIKTLFSEFILNEKSSSPPVNPFYSLKRSNLQVAPDLSSPSFSLSIPMTFTSPFPILSSIV